MRFHQAISKSFHLHMIAFALIGTPIACSGYGDSKGYPGKDPGVPIKGNFPPPTPASIDAGEKLTDNQPACCFGGHPTCGPCSTSSDPFHGGGGGGSMSTPIIDYGWFENDGVLNWDVPLGIYANSHTMSDGLTIESYGCAVTGVEDHVTSTSSYAVLTVDTDEQWHFHANAGVSGDTLRRKFRCANGYTNAASQMPSRTSTWGQIGDYQAIAQQGMGTGTLVASGFNDAYDTAFLMGWGGVITPNSTGVGITTATTSPDGFHFFQSPEMVAIPSSTSGDTALGIVYSTLNAPCYIGKTEFGCPSSTHTGYSGVAASKTVGPLFGTTVVTLATNTDTKATLCGLSEYYGPASSVVFGLHVDYNSNHTVTMTSVGNVVSGAAWCDQ